MKEKKQVGFNILKKDPMDGHKGFGKGSLTLDNVSPVIINVEDKSAVVDMGAMHARSLVEKGIKFLPNQDEVPNGKPYFLVWVTTDKNENGPFYAGVTSCYMTVDREARRGYKLLPEHVNRMDKSIKRYIMLENLDDSSKEVLKQFLIAHNEAMWNNSSEELHTALQC